MFNSQESGSAVRTSSAAQRPQQQRKVSIPDYSLSPSRLPDHILSFLIGFALGFVIPYVFYRILLVSLIGGFLVGIINIFLAQNRAIEKRMKALRVQFYDMLEAMSVAMRAGNPMVKAMQSAREDLSLIYPEDSDIITEIDIMLSRFNNAIPLSKALADFAERSGLEDIKSFAAVYATIEGKSSRADEIVRETQQIISDKMEIEMEIDTLMTSAKQEVNIMLAMPLVVLLMIGKMGAGFMDAIYTTTLGRLVATAGLIVFIVAFVLAKKFSNVEI